MKALALKLAVIALASSVAACGALDGMGTPGPEGAAGPTGPAGPPGPMGASPFILSSGDALYPGGSVGIGEGVESPLAATLDVRGTVHVEVEGGPALTVSSQGGLEAGAASFMLDNPDSLAAAVLAEVNSDLVDLGPAAISGRASGLGGTAGQFHASNSSGLGPALHALADGGGPAIRASARGTGDGLVVSALGTGGAIYGAVAPSGSGRTAVFEQLNPGNGKPVVEIRGHGSGPLLLVAHPSTTVAPLAMFANGPLAVARINASGRGYFNGGTQVGGADLAEVVPTSGALPGPGDVVEIDPDRPNHFRLSTGASSPLVAGVITTEPGVLMNAKGAERDVSGPGLALVGRVPVKVTDEGGPIRIGDLLVAARTPGRAMRAPANPALGTIVGKALEATSERRATIEMLVMLR